MKRFLVTGANGVFGSALVHKLCTRYGATNILASDIKNPKKRYPCNFITLDALNFQKYERMVRENNINFIVQLANPIFPENEFIALKQTKNAVTHNTFDIAHKQKCAIFMPSSMDVFGNAYSQKMAPEDGYRSANSINGICNAYLELVGEYYHKKCGLDFRCVRYPLILSPNKLAMYNSINYFNEMLQKASAHDNYKCPIEGNTFLPMISLDDAIEFTLKCINTDIGLVTRSVYNLNGQSMSPNTIMKEINAYNPKFSCTCEPDIKNKIANELPASLQDTSNRDFDWFCDAGKGIHNIIANALQSK
jgi:threonine 3-dehydrogenase